MRHADMITISLEEPNAVPLYGVASQIIYALKASDVRDVWINGRPIVRDRNVLTLNRDQVLAKARELAAKVSSNSLKH